MGRRSYAGGAVEASLVNPVDANALTLNVDTLDGWPDGSVGPFSVIIDKGSANEEKCLATASSAGAISLSVRGYDGTAQVPHAATAKVRLCITAIDLDEANAHVNSSTGVHGLNPGDKVVGASTPATFTGKTIDGGQNTILNLDLSSFPSVVTALDTINQKNIEQDAALANRYTKSESDGRYVIQGSIGSSVPTGTVMPYAGSVAPSGFLLCDGSAVDRTTYASLFAVIGTLYGGGNGTSTFNLPDLRGRMPVGMASGSGDFASLGQVGGAKTKTLTITEMPAHDHTPGAQTSGAHTHGGATAAATGGTFVNGISAATVFAAGTQNAALRGYTTVADTHSHAIPNDPGHSHQVATQGGGLGFSILPPYLSINFLIKV